MNTISSTTAGALFLLCAVPIFVILYVTISGSLQRSAMLGKNATIAVALCATFLCMLGLYEVLIPRRNTNQTDVGGRGIGFDFLLIPYAALALAILAVLLLLFVQKVLGHDDGTKPHRETFWRRETSCKGKNLVTKPRSSQDLRRLRKSSGLVGLGPGNELDNPRKRQGNPSQRKEMSK
jgi:hypothetical protein